MERHKQYKSKKQDWNCGNQKYLEKNVKKYYRKAHKASDKSGNQVEKSLVENGLQGKWSLFLHRRNIFPWIEESFQKVIH